MNEPTENDDNESLSQGEVDWLVSQLARLIHNQGAETFVGAPLIVASPDFFPDPWTPDPEGVSLILRRSLALSGIPDPHVHLIDHTPLSEEQLVEAPELHFLGISSEGDFEMDLSCVSEASELLGVMSHEIGMAYMEAQLQSGGPFRESQPPEEDPVVAQALGTIASVYLGFGIPATNAAHHARHGGYVVGDSHVTEWAITTAGGLSPTAIEFLLALQLVIRNRPEEQTLASKLLGSNQRASVDDWIEELTTERASWIKRLQLPAEEDWTLEDPAQWDETPGSHSIEVPVEASEVEKFNQGQPIFRVASRRTQSQGFAGVVAGLVVGIALFVPLQLPAVIFAGAGIGLVAGLWRGITTRKYECSDGACRRLLSAQSKTCSGCGGTIRGELQNANERLAALEALEEEQEQS